MNTKTFFASRKGFTLIELLVVIGILAVLAAIAIPSVAGLIDRANKSADQTNANEMTNAMERFASEYELYCQDIASGVVVDENSDGVPDNMDAAQSRVFNVTGAVTRADIATLEGDGLAGKVIDRDTKYPTNDETAMAIVKNYTKTSSATFEPKQSDCSFWYNLDCGLVVVAETDTTIAQLNDMVVSGKDAKGNELNDTNANWTNLTLSSQPATGIYLYRYYKSDFIEFINNNHEVVEHKIVGIKFYANGGGCYYISTYDASKNHITTEYYDLPAGFFVYNENGFSYGIPELEYDFFQQTQLQGNRTSDDYKTLYADWGAYHLS